jgi:DNA repair protein RadC
MRINSSQKAYKIFEKSFESEVEELWVLALNSDLEIIDKKLLFRGTVDRCLIHPRDIIRFLCSQNASAFIIAHNHPSGDPRPSKEDLEITKKIVMLSKLTEIPLKDHLILSKQSYFSFADAGILARLFEMRSLRLRP